MPFEQEFWSYLDRLVSDSQIVIDRPRYSPHPEYPEWLYPLDYGYLSETHAIDGGGVDVWVGSLHPQLLDSLVLTIDLQKRDAEIKLLLGCDESEKRILLDFLNADAMRASLIRRENGLSWLRSRRSVRSFQPRPVPEETLNRVLEAATWAPSAHNRQPWRFVILASLESRESLAKAMGERFFQALRAEGLNQEQAQARVQRSRQRILSAPTLILLCLDSSQGDPYPDLERQQAELWMGVQSTALAGGYLQLAANSLGLASLWMCAPLFTPLAVQQSLSLPRDWQPQALILLGYPAQTPIPRQRYPIQEVTLFL
jgi:F420 biosynthesis protein FbiB-like protein